ncbi:MAG: anion transporter, partial [Armatimonadota bacterium]
MLSHSRMDAVLLGLAYITLFLTYLGLGLGYLPGYRMNRAAIALTGAALLIVVGVLDLERAWGALDPNTLAFLFGVMVLNAHLGYAGFFQLVLNRLVHLARTPLGLLMWLTFATGALSALFLNDTIAILFTPLVLEMTRQLRLPPVPYLLALAGATNLGSVATLTGNPQNILVGSFSGIAFLDFAAALTPVALVGLLLQVGLLYALYPAVRSTRALPPLPEMRFRMNRGLLFKGAWVTVALLVAFVLNYPLAQAALVAAGILLWSRRLRSERFFLRVDWELLVLFAGLFMVTEAVKLLGLLEPLQPLAAAPWGLLWVTAGLS